MNLDNRQIADLINSQHSVNGQDCAICEFNYTNVSSCDDVVICQNRAVRSHEKTCAPRYRSIVVRHDDCYDCSLSCFGYRWYVFFRWRRLRGNHTTSDKNQGKKFHFKTPDHSSLLYL